MTYDEALNRLQTIVSSLESNEAISIDECKKKALEAKQLLDFCREQLTQIEEEIEVIFEDKLVNKIQTIKITIKKHKTVYEANY